jgi:hypothetical protein
MKARTKSTDPVAEAILPALRQAARNARKLAVETGTPFWVMRKGKMVNLNPNARPRQLVATRAVPKQRSVKNKGSKTRAALN